jgi:hypothetical protein
LPEIEEAAGVYAETKIEELAEQKSAPAEPIAARTSTSKYKALLGHCGGWIGRGEYREVSHGIAALVAQAVAAGIVLFYMSRNGFGHPKMLTLFLPPETTFRASSTQKSFGSAHRKAQGMIS